MHSGLAVPSEIMNSLCDLREGPARNLRSYGEVVRVGEQRCRRKARLSGLIKQSTPLGQVVFYRHALASMVRWEGDVWTIKSGAMHGKCESITSAKARKEKLSATTEPSGDLFIRGECRDTSIFGGFQASHAGGGMPMEIDWVPRRRHHLPDRLPPGLCDLFGAGDLLGYTYESRHLTSRQNGQLLLGGEDRFAGSTKCIPMITKSVDTISGLALLQPDGVRDTYLIDCD